MGVGEYGNAIFPHLNAKDQYCGYEIKNRPPAGKKQSFTGFAEGGERGLFMGCLEDGCEMITRIVIAEAAIDVMSFAQIFHEPNTLYVSTGGTALSRAQQEQLQDLFDLYPKATLILAMDNDEVDKDGNFVELEDRAGEIMGWFLAGLAFGMKVVRLTPILKDWNEYLTVTRGPKGLAA